MVVRGHMYHSFNVHFYLGLTFRRIISYIRALGIVLTKSSFTQLCYFYVWNCVFRVLEYNFSYHVSSHLMGEHLVPSYISRLSKLYLDYTLQMVPDNLLLFFFCEQAFLT